MATTKTTTARAGAKSGTTRAKAGTAKSTAAKTATPKASTAKATTGKPASTRTTTPRAKTDDSLVARTGRTIKERPYTSAAIATGAVGVVAAFLVSRRDKSFKEASGELTAKVKDGFATASETVKDGLASATETVKDLGQRGADYFKADSSDGSSDTRSQREIAEEALSLKATGATSNPAEELSSTETKAGAISY